MAIEFIYFDLGMVLLKFSVQRMLEQMGATSGLDPARVKEILFGSNLHEQYELGQVSTAEYYEAFCQAAGTRPSCEALTLAGSDIFELNTSIVPVVAQLRAARYRLGILSNTCEAHWQFCHQHFYILHEIFQVHALSYELKAVKPNAAIFQRAAELAGVAPDKIFFTDDLAGHIAGAKAAGFNAVQYTGTPDLVAALHQHGVCFNY
jgi:putative hydrolase of the HAD superfamily